MAFPTSGKNNPCPVCDRISDKDCRILEGGNLILCHTYPDGENGNKGYKFLHRSQNNGLWGVWISEKPQKVFREKPELQEFIYRNASGKPFIKVVRKKLADGKKTFSQIYWNPQTGNWEKYQRNDAGAWKSDLSDELRERLKALIPIYRFNEVQDAIANGQPIWWTEGEGCADALWALGIPATTSIGGSKGFSNYGTHYAEQLGGATIILCPDRDQQGIAYMEEVAAKLAPNSQWCRVYPKSPLWQHLPENGGLDIEDWLAEGAELTDLMSAIAPHWKIEKTDLEETPEYDAVLDVVEELDIKYEDQSRLDWELKNLSYERGWAKRGLTAGYLYRQMTARRDSEGDLKIENAHDIMKDAGDGREWWIQGLVPRGTVITFYAKGGTGKTSFLHHLMKHVGTGSNWCGYRAFKTRSLMIQADEPRQDIGDKLQTARFFDLAPEDCMDFVTQWRFTQIRQLRRAIERNGYGLIGIDSYTSANAGTGIELTKSNAGDPLYLLRNIASELNVTFIVIHHENAAGGMRDSTTINDNVSEVWRMGRPNREVLEESELGKNDLILDITKSRAGLKGRYVLEQQPKDFSWVHRGTLAFDYQMDSVRDLIKDKNQNGRKWVAPKEIADILHKDFDEIEATMEQARRIGLLDSKWQVYDRADGTMGRFRLYCTPEFNDYPVELETPSPKKEEHHEEEDIIWT